MKPREQEIWTISQVTRRIKALLETEINHVWVAGEISNWRVSPAGHAYFTLKDADSQIDAVIFKGKLGRVAFEPENGLEVVVFGLVSVYERRGNYQIICDEMHPKGMGALQLAFERLKKKLDDEGLFAEEHKKPLPLLPQRIGIVTSPAGAAIRDMLNVIGRRFANVHILLYPARVQGDEAAAEIVQGIKTLDRMGVDVIIAGRGGGSLEDLWPFNEESVVRAIFSAKTPIISAVGHEIDFTLADFAADLRAPTPSAAAELVVQEQEVLVARVAQLRRRLAKSLGAWVERARHRLAVAQASYVFRRPEELIRQPGQEVDELRMRMQELVLRRLEQARNRQRRASQALVHLSPVHQVARAQERLADLRRRIQQNGANLVERGRNRLRPVAAHLHALSPLAILSRGYALVWKHPDRTLVRAAGELEPHDAIEITLGKGSAFATVNHIEEGNHG